MINHLVLDYIKSAGVKRISPWIWIPGLFCAQGIPTAIFTFVSLLMFIRFDVGYSLATVFMSMLFVPSVLKSFFRSRIRLIRSYKLSINIVEGLIFVTLCAMALSTHSHNASPESLFIWMFLISMLCSWHELLARMYYEKTLNFGGSFLFAPTLEEGRLMVLGNRGFLPVERMGTLPPAHASIRRLPICQGKRQLCRTYCLFWRREHTQYYIEEFAETLRKLVRHE